MNDHFGEVEANNELPVDAWTDDGLALELVSVAVPDETALSSVDQTHKPILRNGFRTNESRRVTPIDPATILLDIQTRTDGWPMCVAGELVIKSSLNKLEIKNKDAAFFAWLYEHFQVDWHGSPAISKKEFFEYCRSNSERYSDSSHFPHFPPIADVLYHHQSFAHKNGQALSGFLDFFSPSTVHDRELIMAFVLTLFWGGPPNARPGFLITTADDTTNQGRGWGKTTLLEMCAELCGGMISASKSETIEALKQRILNQADHEPRPRVIAIDNVKTRRFSSADLEALITSRQISGKVLYRGNGSVPNHHTVAVTINDPCLSKDLAQRFAYIKLGEPAFTQTWQRDIEQYVRNNRWAIIGDIGQLLMSEGTTLPDEGTGRRGYWELGVLSKLNEPIALRALIKTRETDYDDDAANGMEFVKYLLENMFSFKINSSSVAKIPQDIMHQMFNICHGEKIGANGVKKKVYALGLPCLHQVSKTGKTRFWLFRTDGQALTPEQIAAATSHSLEDFSETESDEPPNT